MRTKFLQIVCAIAVVSFSAMADDGHDNNNNNNGNSSLEASVIGSMPATAIGGITSGGAPWVVKHGESSVSSGGRIRVELGGLLIASGNLAGTTGPVTMVGATLVCGGTGGTPVPVPDIAITPSPLSSRGNAEINQAVTIPAACFGPVVLVRAFNPGAPLGSQLGAFIAVSGLMLNTAQGHNENPGGYGDNSGGGQQN